MLLQYWGAWRLHTKSADEGFSLLCRAMHCSCTTWPYWAVWQEPTALEAQKVGRPPGLAHTTAWTSSAGRDVPFLETATVSSQVPGTGGSVRSCSATLIAPVPWTTTENDLVRASVEVWEDSSIALWNPHLPTAWFFLTWLWENLTALPDTQEMLGNTEWLSAPIYVVTLELTSY